jgi:hypothetical protein
LSTHKYVAFDKFFTPVAMHGHITIYMDCWKVTSFAS